MAFVNLLAAELLSRVGSWPLDDLTDWRYLSQKEHQYLYVLMYINVQWKNIEAVCKHWKQAVANCRLGDAESPRRAFFRRCYSGALQIVVVSDNLWKLHLRTTTLEESALKSVGAKPGKAVGHIGKKTLMTCGNSLLKREWHGLTSSVSKLDEHLYFDSQCLRTSEIVIE